jgi:hypothetical protein
MEHIKQIKKVLDVLARNRDKHISALTIALKLENEIAEYDIERILKYFEEKGVVSCKYATDVDGNELPIFQYAITTQAILTIEKVIEDSKNKLNKQDEKYSSLLWFQVGLVFAKGEMKILLGKFDNNYTKVAKHLRNVNYRPYISESVSKTNTSAKNIFSDQKKLRIIQEYCIRQNITLDPDFINSIKPI